MRPATLVLVLTASAAAFLGAQTEKLDHAMLGRIRDEGLVMDRAVARPRGETLGPRSVMSTDHVPFDEAGVPAFQFMVERLE